MTRRLRYTLVGVASCRVDCDVVAGTDFQGHGFVLQPSGSRAF